MRNILIALWLSIAPLVALTQEIELYDDNLPVQCGDGEQLLRMSIEDFGEEVTAMWDSAIGQYVVMTSESSEMTLFLLIRDSDYACVISTGANFKFRPRTLKGTL